ncbi:acetate--CoA ligase [Planctomycetota bacterium]|nr:acetate--CoA ligase [Planctomycetota bacterium]
MSQTQGSTESGSTMESILDEHRHFKPSKAFSSNAHIKSMAEYEKMHKRSVDDPEGFWADVASELHWFKKWEEVLDWRLPDAKWFVGGTTNICYNCIDRQIDAGLGNHTAIVWEGEPIVDEDGHHAGGEPEVRKLSYYDLRREVSRFANALKGLGVQKGDVVTIYMPMVPELAIAMLACARIGAVHSIIFGGFSASAIRDRVEDGKSKIVITADGGWRRGKVVPLKDNVDEALTLTDLVDTVVVLERCQNDIHMVDGRDHWWSDLTATASEHCPAEEMYSEDLLFILYTSGSTGKPKGIMHTTGGYMVYTYLTSRYTFDLHPRQLCDEELNEQCRGDMYWCTADIGWITGHSYIIYGLLPNRVPTLMYEGAPDFPEKDRFWDIIERHKVTKFYTAPTAIRAFMKWGREWIDKHDISSLKVLGTVGEPINPEAWMWYHKVIGNEKCPIVDTWWQTETGGHMLTPLPGATTTTPGSCTKPFFGIDAAVVNSEGEEVGENEGGILVIRKPWPSMLRGIYGNRERFIETYWSKIEGFYTAGDGARKDENGNFWIMGRIDDVIVVAGHNLGTMEVESALVSHDAVAEAAVVGFPHEIKGTGIAAFATLVGGIEETDKLKAEIRDHVAKELGPISKPDKLRFTPALPKTRSGKIMRRLLRDIAAGREITGDVTTLEDKGIVEKLQKQTD